MFTSASIIGGIIFHIKISHYVCWDYLDLLDVGDYCQSPSWSTHVQSVRKHVDNEEILVSSFSNYNWGAFFQNSVSPNPQFFRLSKTTKKLEPIIFITNIKWSGEAYPNPHPKSIKWKLFLGLGEFWKTAPQFIPACSKTSRFREKIRKIKW